MATSARVLMVSKPVAPPWNDSSKNLVRDLAGALRRHRATVMTRAGVALALPGVASEAVYGEAPALFAPALAANARVFLRLLRGDRHDLWHFFFAPNPRSSLAGALAARVRRVPALQTVCSAPAPSPHLERLLFADRIVVLSRSTERRLIDAGISATRIRRIAPAVTPPRPASDDGKARARADLRLPCDQPLIVYPGDLEFSSGAEYVIRAHAALRNEHTAVLVLACRAKTARARDHELRLRELVRELDVGDSTHFVGEIPTIHALLASADVVALPAETLYAKMDLPLVLIEAMMLGRAVITAQGTAAAELAEADAALAVAPTVQAVTSALRSLLDDPDERVRLGERARQSALARYHPAIMASAYEAVYDELLS